MKLFDLVRMFFVIHRARRDPLALMKRIRGHIYRSGFVTFGGGSANLTTNHEAQRIVAYCEVLVMTGAERSPDWWRS